MSFRLVNPGMGEWSPFEQEAYGRQGWIPGRLNLPFDSLLTEVGLFALVDQMMRS